MAWLFIGLNLTVHQSFCHANLPQQQIGFKVDFSFHLNKIILWQTKK